jgi:NADH:ubiquinone oxidoreductase 27 kD subunit
MNTVEDIFSVLEEKFGAKRDMQDKWGVAAIVSAAYLHNAALFLKDAAAIKFEMLVDIAGIDYLTYPNHEGPRFAISYAFKSMSVPGARIRLKVLVGEADLKVPTLSDLSRTPTGTNAKCSTSSVSCSRAIRTSAAC